MSSNGSASYAVPWVQSEEISSGLPGRGLPLGMGIRDNEFSKLDAEAPARLSRFSPHRFVSLPHPTSHVERIERPMETIWRIRAAVAGTLVVLGLILTPGCSSGDSNGTGDDAAQATDEAVAAPGDDMAGMPPPAMPEAAPDMAAPADEAAEPAPAPAPAPSAADGGGAATDELLAQAKTAAPAAPPAEAASPPAPGAPAAPGPGAAADPMSPEAMAMAMQAPGDAANAQAPPGPDAAMQAAMEAAMTNDAAPGDPSGSIADAIASPGASGGSGKEPSFKYPITGAQAFLDAVKAKDPQKLNDAVALRSRLESSASRRSLFEQILDSSVPSETLQELADAFEGYKIVRLGAVEGTGHQDVILMKAAGKDNLQRALTLRKEKAGWKVSDFSGVRKFEGQNLRRSRGRGMMRRRR